MAEEPTGKQRPRTPRSVRVARWVLFALLIGSAALTLFGLPELQRAVAAGRWPAATLALPPALLAVFIVGYAAYRIALVRAGRYTAGKALVQIAVMVLVLGIVAGVALVPGESAAPGQVPVDLLRPLASADPEVRALAAEVARHRPRAEALEVAPRLAALLDDPAPEVRRQAHASLVAIAGADVGGDGPGAAARWRAWSRSAGGPEGAGAPR
jgi:hypothetical protein